MLEEIKAGGDVEKRDVLMIYTPGEAVKYLQEKRGIYMSVTSLRMRRNRNKAHAARVLGRISLWTKEELDMLPVPRRSPKQEEKENAQLGDDHSPNCA